MSSVEELSPSAERILQICSAGAAILAPWDFDEAVFLWKSGYIDLRIAGERVVAKPKPQALMRRAG
jgi:hypothetical protein